MLQRKSTLERPAVAACGFATRDILAMTLVDPLP